MNKGQKALEIKKTADGSHTIFNAVLDEHYHSLHGSIQEAEHVFISKGLEYRSKTLDQINILEVGFGTGLNALLSVLHHKDLEISYVGLEPFPVDMELLKALNYTDLLDDRSIDLYEKIHSCSWNEQVQIESGFGLMKFEEGIQNFRSEKKFDLVYFDAFAPRPQAEMWLTEVFEKCYSIMNEGACLVTYCAKGQVRRNMQEAGFEVDRLDGPPGKREMLRASKNG